MRLFQPNELVFDIGAHHGESALRYLDEGKAGLVVCLEPLWSNYTKLCALNSYGPRVKLIHAGAWSRAKIVEIRPASPDSGMSSMVADFWGKTYPGTKFGAGEPVACLTIDDLCNSFGNPTFVKIDVEGCETEVLAGMTVLPPTLSIEFTGNCRERSEDLVEQLFARGYTRGRFTPEEVEIDGPDLMPIAELIHRLKTTKPAWGNIVLHANHDF